MWRAGGWGGGAKQPTALRGSEDPGNGRLHISGRSPGWGDPIILRFRIKLKEIRGQLLGKLPGGASETLCKETGGQLPGRLPGDMSVQIPGTFWGEAPRRKSRKKNRGELPGPGDDSGEASGGSSKVITRKTCEEVLGGQRSWILRKVIAGESPERVQGQAAPVKYRGSGQRGWGNSPPQA